ncbi:class I SAM-dependent methyltransferase [Sulfurirhabdus autotrophica]|uniref:Methyltransferase family protein n=1 Tax=Sulfurirhabdus autotrophica TaxID=1706046 RepID=A0A4R3XZD0_9PROT|nr:class I SAM-dependent methyltransferase [Sulfurirhabdus autotrophica]TCV85135.1 methyltransferase family protein [Sulfurirhabdus autotrophica]
MHRTPEPELMDTPEQALAYASTDFSEPHDAFVAHFRQRFPDFHEGEVLDLGCGTADVAMRFCWVYPGAQILGVDGAPAMLQCGQEMIDGNELGGHIHLEHRYLPDETLAAQHFDAVISNSLLHHLDDPMTLWETVKQVAKPGAPVLVMDLMRPTSIVEAFQFVRQYASDAPPHMQKDFYHSLLASYRQQEVKRQLYKADLDHFQVEIVSDRHILIWGTMDV